MDVDLLQPGPGVQLHGLVVTSLQRDFALRLFLGVTQIVGPSRQDAPFFCLTSGLRGRLCPPAPDGFGCYAAPPHMH